MSISHVLSGILHGKIKNCCLCYQDVQEQAVWIDDEIYIDSQETKTMSELITLFFGEDVVSSVSTFGIFCDYCKDNLINNYRFRKMCKENIKNLTSIIDSVTESFENMLPELENYNTLFVSIDLQDFTSKQYYDDDNLESSSKAFKRLYTILNSTVKVDQENHLKLNKYNIENKKTKFNHLSKIKNIMNSIKAKKEPKVYDIPLVPTSDIAVDCGNNYKCKVCFQKYAVEHKLRWHFFRMHYPRNFKCTKCISKFITDEMLKQHEEEHHKDQVCSECGKVFTSKYVLQKHQLNHSFRISCDECGRVYRSIEAFKKHISDDICSQKSKKTADQANYECDYCNKRYCYKPYLAKHIMHEHGNVEGFRCKFCSKQFYTQSRLNTHLLKHTREKNFVCNICGGRFVTRESLIYHTRLHTGEKPYPCEYCDKAFLSASRRLDHTRRHHLEPSLECNICHAKFKATGSLLKHRKRHFNPKSKLNVVWQSYATPSENVNMTEDLIDNDLK